MEETNEQEVADIIEEEEEVDEAPEPTDDSDALKARIAKLEEKAIAQRERTKLLRQELAKAAKQKEVPQKAEPKTGELDETQLDYLDLKGVSDPDEIDIIQKVMAKTGQTVRQALKDDYVQARLEKLRADKQVKDATPSSTRRSGASPSNDLATAIAKYEANGELPADFTLRSQVINSKVERESMSIPPWQKK